MKNVCEPPTLIEYLTDSRCLSTLASIAVFVEEPVAGVSW